MHIAHARMIFVHFGIIFAIIYAPTTIYRKGERISKGGTVQTTNMWDVDKKNDMCCTTMYTLYAPAGKTICVAE